MQTISKRLQRIVHYIPQGAKVADIGSDHAYLPTYLVQNDISSYVIAGEVNEGPYQSARQHVASMGLQDAIHVRKGDGLSVLCNGEVDTITIAGMGGRLIVQILEDGKHVLSSVKHLILQPNVGGGIIRAFAFENGWELIAEEILEEDGHIYEILAFQLGDGSAPYQNKRYPLEMLIKMGPFLIEQRDAAFYKKWERELNGLKMAISSLQKATTEDSRIKLQQFKQEYDQIKEVLSD